MVRRGLAYLLAVALAALAAPLVAAGATSDPGVGAITSARQDMFFHTVTVAGDAYWPSHTDASMYVRVYFDGTYVGTVHANRPSPTLDAALHITGAHNFVFAKTWTHTVTTVMIRYTLPTHYTALLATKSVTHFMPPAGTRIISVAKRYVGYPYVDGGASPSGFDCSGFTRYVYSVAHVTTLPHSAEGQRVMSGMRLISRSTARPGDLVFYMSGGTAYHVAIYAGSGMQYAAATPQDGVRYQAVWSSAVQYRTDWHS
jgi:hypothetical protein